jgi:hypothetical protein
MENPSRQALRAVLFVVLGMTIGFVPGLIRVDQLRQEMKTVSADTAKQIAELKQTSLGWHQMHDECVKVMEGDGTKTLLYGRQDDDMWLINRRVTPQKPVNALFLGAYSYVHPDGTIEGPFQPRPINNLTQGNR